MNAHIVFYNQKTPFETLAKDAELCAKPSVGDSIEYEEDWSLALVTGVYVLRDSVEVHCREWFDEEELAKLVALGWEVRGRR